MIKITKKEDCCGCSACEQICSVAAIAMQEDKQGFLYPNVDMDKCVQCGRCLKVCPILNRKAETEFEQEAYLIQHKDLHILKESTSGGAFTAIAQAVLSRGGVVFGAAYDESFNVRHIYVETENELYKFRNSKYVQSSVNNSYRTVKHFLEENRYVCFSGTPCQIEGLLNYLGKDSPYLLTVDVVCHSVPSPAVWRTYLNILQKTYGEDISNLRFRDKNKYGYLYSQFAIHKKNGKAFFEGIEKNMMLRAFFSEICNRPSCYSCKFKKIYKRSDITIWDCFDLKEFSKSNRFHLENGISRMLVHSDTGKKYIKDILKNCCYEQITVENALHYDAKEMTVSVEKNARYDEFWSSFEKSPEETMLKFFPVKMKQKAENIVRVLAFKTGLYAFVRFVYKLTFGNRRR